MRILIIGAGAVGFDLARRLADEDHEVVIVDSDAAKVRHASDNLDILAIHGNGASIPVLDEAGLERADILVAVARGDEVNLMACLIAARRGVPVKIARVSHPEYHTAESVLSREELGVDLLIGPEQESAWELFQLLSSGAGTDLARFAEGRVQLLGMRVREGAPVADRTVAELDQELGGRDFVLAALVRGGKTEIPTGASRIEAGDKVFLMASSERMGSLPPLAGYEPFRLRRVMIAGGSDEAVYLARHLEEAGVACTIIEISRERCRALAELLPKALILNGNATDLELLELEGVEGIDGYVALTDRDEINMLSALLAKNVGARRVIPLIHRVDYMPLVERVGLDAAVSPRISAVNAILRHVRRGNVASVATLKGTRAEAIELVVGGGAKVAGRKVRDAGLPPGAVMGAIVRRDRVILPRGHNVIRPTDRVILFVTPEALSDVERMFA
ncbi:MAG TPA: Trk system potassium transporter TrkA [Longimicrobiales bacterium]|nr:Trk system potassium transporter TrkA [Longimicrobiales bacterium]